MRKWKHNTTMALALILVFALLLSATPASALELMYAKKTQLSGLNLPIDKNLVVKNGTIVFEAEDICLNYGGVVTADEKASGGQAMLNASTRWDVGQITKDDINTNIYVENPEDAGSYRVWLRARTTNSESGSIFIDPGTGVWAASFYSSTRDGEYRWSSANIELSEGKNYIAFRGRTSGLLDKIIVTNNMSFTPEGKDDEPIFLTPEEEEALWRTYWKEPEVKPISGHPRLLLTNDYMPTFKKNLESDEISWIRDKFYKYAYEELNCKLDTTKANNHNAILLAKIMGRCLVWVLGDETNPAYARQTINYMKDYLETVRTPDDTGDITRSRGNILYTVALVYDWCYDQLTIEDKDYFVDSIIKLVLSKEIGWPPVKMSDISTHAGEQEIFRDLLGAGIAIYDEYPLLYDLAAGRMYECMAPARIWLRSAGRFDQGHDYAAARSYSELWGDITMQRMGYPSIYGDVGSLPYRWRISARMPYGRMIPDGDMYSLTGTSYKGYYVDYVLTMCIAGNLYKDPYVKLEFKRNQISNNIDDYLQFFVMLFTDPTVTTAVWDDQPLAFRATYPLSAIVARTNWQEGFNSNAAMAFMDMHQVYVGDHQHKYTGSFQLYYKGLLAMDTGTYNASNQHNEGYSHRAISANTMLVYDPSETFRASWSKDALTVKNDGGQRLPYEEGSSVMRMSELELDKNGQAQNESLNVAKDVRTYVGPNTETPEFTYITGDLTNAYTSKVTDYHRSMVFMDLNNDKYPAALVVYDKIDSSKPDFRKVWLLHSQEKPEVNGNTTIIERKENGFGGRLVNKTLTPSVSNQKHSIIGGEANEMFVIDGLTMTPKAGAIEGGKYRIEISPKQAAKADTFLNAMFVTDAGNNEELPMIKEVQGAFTGVTIMDKMVLFEKNACVAETSFSITARNNGYNTVSVFVGGVKPGVWTVTGPDGFKQNISVSEESYAAYFKGKPGRYTLTPAVEGTKPDTVVYEKMAKREIGDFMIWNNDGYYIYLEKPTRVIDGVPYVAVDVLKEFGASVTVDGSTAQVTSALGTAVITASSNEYTIDGAKNALSSVPQFENGTVYVNPAELKDFLGYSFKYTGNLSRVMRVSKEE